MHQHSLGLGVGAWSQVPPADQVIHPAGNLEHLLCARHVLVLGREHSPVPVEANTRENVTRTDGMWGLSYKGTEQDIRWSKFGQGSLTKQMGRG